MIKPYFGTKTQAYMHEKYPDLFEQGGTTETSNLDRILELIPNHQLSRLTPQSGFAYAR